MDCPLCCSRQNRLFFQGKDRPFYQCHVCLLVFVPASHYLSIEAERGHYRQHDNHPEDPGYRAFLSRLCVPLCKRLAPHSSGLDFGSGPGPTLSVMLEETGHKVAIYDPAFAPDMLVLNRQYQFITATEVVEHLHTPGKILNQLNAILLPGGWLGIMTSLAPDKRRFPDWHYKNDPTHVCFYSSETFGYIAHRFHYDLEFLEGNVILLKKKVDTEPDSITM